MRRGVRDGAAPGFKLPKTKLPEPIIPGVRGWQTSEGWTVLRLHYTADPERTTEAWLAEHLLGYRGGMEGRDWRREMEVDFSAYKGEPVYPEFDSEDAIKATRYNPHLPLWRGWDFGYRHPAVVWAQLWPDNTLAWLHELYPTLNPDEVPGISTGPLADLAISETERLFPGSADLSKSAGVLDFCDPAGNQKKDASDFSSIEILQQKGINPEWSVVGRKNRIEYIRRYVGTGKFRINPSCTLGIKAFSAAYRLPEENKGGADPDMPDLGKKVQAEPYIHIMDAFEYIAACNLQIEWLPTVEPSNPRRERQDVGDLAAMYLGSVQAAKDYDEEPKPIDQGLEAFLSEFIGDEDDGYEAYRLD